MQEIYGREMLGLKLDGGLAEQGKLRRQRGWRQVLRQAVSSADLSGGGSVR